VRRRNKKRGRKKEKGQQSVLSAYIVRNERERERERSKNKRKKLIISFYTTEKGE